MSRRLVALPLFSQFKFGIHFGMYQSVAPLMTFSVSMPIILSSVNISQGTLCNWRRTPKGSTCHILGISPPLKVCIHLSQCQTITEFPCCMFLGQEGGLDYWHPRTGACTGYAEKSSMI